MLNTTKILLRYTTKVTGEENRDREREREREYQTCKYSSKSNS